MFDELARKGEVNNHVNDQIPASIQKRLSLVAVHSQRNTIFGQICAGKTEQATMQQENRVTDPSLERRASPQSTRVEITVCSEKENDEIKKSVNDDQQRNVCINKILYERNDKNTLTPQYGRRRKHLDRPLSGSSIASSTSSSGCSNQGNTESNNPYLASVESLADTCASSQGSGDSGVVTTSEASSRIRGPISHPRNSTIDPSPPFFFHRARYCDPQRNPVEKVLLEIVDTEAIYVEHLRQVIQGYLIFWRDDPASLLQQPELNNLFSNIEDIFQFNREFLDEIEACGLDAVKVANTFTKRNSGFKVYTEYCTNYPRTVETLTDLMGREETAEAFRERQAALCHALPLGSFLLKPVQRILKYHLLLENLSKEYGTREQNHGNCEGQTAIGEALEAMMGIAKHINAMKRRHEHAVRVQEIQSLLYGWPGPDLTTSGELVAEGRFRMKGAKAPRHAFLFERMLLLTKKKEDGLLVYKAHIMCSNLMLIESIPGEPCSFHVIPFDNPRLQYTLQARNLEQKREWTLQIKQVMLENYNAVIPSHARQLVLQLGQTQQDDDVSYDRISMKKQYSSPPEYLERRKQEKERRRSEAGLRQKGKKVFKSGTTENSPSSTRKINSTDEPRDRSLNRSLDGRASKVRDRFANWRRKSEPGFQSYVSLNQSDCEQIEKNDVPVEVEVVDENLLNEVDDSEGQNQEKNNASTKDVNEQQKQSPPRTVEEIVGHILMQNQEFQRLLEKQRNNSMANVRQQQRFNKHHITIDTSDDSDNGGPNYPSDLSSNNNSNLSISSVNNNTRGNRFSRRENRLVRSNNAWNSRTSPQGRENQPNLKLQYNNLKTDSDKSQTDISKNKINHRVYEKRAMFETFKRQSIVTESKIIKTALRIRENSSCEETRNSEKPKNEEDGEKIKEIICDNCDSNFENSTLTIGNYDNLQHVWQDLGNRPDSDSPTRPAVWLTKLCEGLPTSPQKCGSLPRSFQMSPSPQEAITKARFLQRDGKPMTERPFTIASDKPAEINLEDMERYASSYQPEGRIAKFPTSASTSSTFFCSLDDNLTDADHMTIPETNIHPDHKIYRANLGSTMLKSVLSKAGSRLQGLRSTVSAETLDTVEDYDRNKKQCNKGKKKSKSRLSRESSTDVDEPSVSCIPSNSTFTLPSLYYKQGSSGLGARIAQADYADPSVLFFDSKRPESTMSEGSSLKNILNPSESHSVEAKKERNPSETDSFYERCFETIENYVDAETDDAFRDSAIFSDAEDVNHVTFETGSENIVKKVRVKVAPPVPVKRKPKPSVARKPENLKIRAKVVRKSEIEPQCIKVTVSSTNQSEILKKSVDEKHDVSAGQSQAGWVKKMVGQLQSQIES